MKINDFMIPQIKVFRKVWYWVIILLLIHAALLAYSATQHSPTELEGPLLAAGVSHWQLGRYELYRVNPPLVRMVAAIPVVGVGCQTNWGRFIEGKNVRPEYSIGCQFIEINGRRSYWLMTLARWACIPFSLLGGIFCFLWGRELYGRNQAGIIALVLWCFNPMILGNGELITNDMGAASLGLGAGYFFWRWLKQSTWKRAAYATVFLALAILAKTTWLILFGLWLLVALVWFIRYSPKEQAKIRWRLMKSLQIVLMFFVAVWIINVFYGFDHSFERYDSFSFTSKAMNRIDNKNTYLGWLPVPFPKQFIVGLDTQIGDLEHFGNSSYLRGEWRNIGWWYYYFYGLLIKTPIGTEIIFCGVLIASILTGLSRFTASEIVLLLPAFVVFVIVSSQLAFNYHFRYILPCLGFAFVFCGKSVLWMEKKRIIKCCVVLLLLWSAFSTMKIYPHSLSYFNEFVGGPQNGYKHMLHSALDWGQDLIQLEKWLKKHPDVKLNGLVYSGGYEPKYVGLDYPKPPLDKQSSQLSLSHTDLHTIGPKPGWYALSVNQIWGWLHDYDYFQKLKPTAYAGYSIYIYHITLEEANRMRREIGLPKLEEVKP
ncbi:MAG: hypothetical protein LBJ67_00760 [Planctomycetaceae bacterium]|jgi:hypothetical protein|nr:hypothetical protein [Planctomycetaceae bacterium]